MPQKLQGPDTLLTGARQTMAAWSKIVESHEDIPVVYKSCFDQHFDSEQRFPHVILTPPLDKSMRKTTETLVCDTDDALHIFERNGNQIITHCYPYRDIYGVELGIILLESWLTISGKTRRGEIGVSTIEFNTTSRRHFGAILNKLRPSPHVTDEAQMATEKDKFNHLFATNFKFANYGRESLIPGETALQILLQREIRQPLWTVFGRAFYKTISLSHLTIVTDREVILIQDAGYSQKTQAARYGGIWQYIPLHCLASATLSEAANEQVTLSICCLPGKTIERLFETSNQPQLEQLCSQLQMLIERTRATV